MTRKCIGLRTPRRIDQKMTHETKPDNFDPRFEIVACFAEHDGKMIVLRGMKISRKAGNGGCRPEKWNGARI